MFHYQESQTQVYLDKARRTLFQFEERNFNLFMWGQILELFEKKNLPNEIFLASQLVVYTTVEYADSWQSRNQVPELKLSGGIDDLLWR